MFKMLLSGDLVAEPPQSTREQALEPAAAADQEEQPIE
jgi:hypothetical protein